MKNRYEPREDGSVAIYAPREVNEKLQEGNEIPFYVSQEDFDHVASISGNWFADYNKGPGRLPYIKASYKGKDVRLHRWIWQGRNGTIPEGMFIDHINRTTIDNRWDNLRIATPTENADNKRKKGDKPSIDPKGLTKQGIVDIVDVENDTPYHESAYVGSIFLGRYKPGSDIIMNWEFNIAQYLLFDEKPRKKIYELLAPRRLTEEDIRESGIQIATEEEMRTLVDKHIDNVLETLSWKPTFLD